MVKNYLKDLSFSSSTTKPGQIQSFKPIKQENEPKSPKDHTIYGVYIDNSLVYIHSGKEGSEKHIISGNSYCPFANLYFWNGIFPLIKPLETGFSSKKEAKNREFELISEHYPIWNIATNYADGPTKVNKGHLASLCTLPEYYNKNGVVGFLKAIQATLGPDNRALVGMSSKIAYRRVVNPIKCLKPIILGCKREGNLYNVLIHVDKVKEIVGGW